MKVLLVFFLAVIAAKASDVVLTPNGYWPQSCVHEIEPFSEVEKLENGFLRVRSPKGNTIELGTCEEDIPRRDSGWIAYAYFDASEFTAFNGTWTVPPEPTQVNHQTVFFFTGLENAAGNEIIQPVLQFGASAAGGGTYWSVANWIVTSSGQALYSKLVQVQDGDSLFGYMVVHSSGGWVVGISVNGATPTYISISKLSAQIFSSVTLEAYEIISCDNYPAGGSITFAGLVEENNKQPITPNWAANTRYTNCGEKVIVQSPQTVTLNY